MHGCILWQGQFKYNLQYAAALLAIERRKQYCHCHAADLLVLTHKLQMHWWQARCSPLAELPPAAEPPLPDAAVVEVESAGTIHGYGYTHTRAAQYRTSLAATVVGNATETDVLPQQAKRMSITEGWSTVCILACNHAPMMILPMGTVFAACCTA